MDIDVKKIKELADLALEKQLAELIVQDGDKSVTIKLPGYHLSQLIHPPQPVVYTPPAPPSIPGIPQVSSHGAPAPEQPESAKPDAAAAGEERLYKITSPMVGTFYSSPSPDSPPYVTAGQAISKGQVVCIIEAMKMMNELESEISGRVVRVLVENAQPVEFGQVLMLVEPI